MCRRERPELLRLPGPEIASWRLMGAPVALLDALGTLLARSWTLLARSWTLMARSWTLLGVSCSTKITPQELRRVILAVLGSILDGF